MGPAPGNNGIFPFATKLICSDMDSFVHLIKYATKSIFQVYFLVCLRDVSHAPDMPQTFWNYIRALNF